jgi:hypothetical protein
MALGCCQLGEGWLKLSSANSLSAELLSARLKLLCFRNEKGKVGEESHLHPAVVEHAAQFPRSSQVVHMALESTVGRATSSSSIQ